jgi:hypothetical protein
MSPTMDSRTSILGLRVQVLCSRTAFCALSDGLGARPHPPEVHRDPLAALAVRAYGQGG